MRRTVFGHCLPIALGACLFVACGQETNPGDETDAGASLDQGSQTDPIKTDALNGASDATPGMSDGSEADGGESDHDAGQGLHDAGWGEDCDGGSDQDAGMPGDKDAMATEDTGSGGGDPDADVPSEYDYDDWGEWSTCSKTCGDGFKERSRECLHHNGDSWVVVDCAFCGGKCTQSLPCNTAPCFEYRYGPWSPWSPCTETCGGGTTERTRSCLAISGDVSKPVDCARCGGDCTSPAEPCNTDPCVEYIYGPWSKPGICSKTCGGGVAQITRECFKVTGGAMKPAPCSACGSEVCSRDVPCNTQACPPDIYPGWGFDNDGKRTACQNDSCDRDPKLEYRCKDGEQRTCYDVLADVITESGFIYSCYYRTVTCR